MAVTVWCRWKSRHYPYEAVGDSDRTYLPNVVVHDPDRGLTPVYCGLTLVYCGLTYRLQSFVARRLEGADSRIPGPGS